MTSSSSVVPGVTAIIGKLSLGLGKDKARQVVAECLREAGLSQISTGGELEKLAERLIERGGFICIVGRSLMVEAIMLRRKDLASAVD